MSLHLPSHRVTQLLFDYETLGRDAMIALCEGLPQKVIRWVGINHPDNQTRKLFYELTGVPMGEGVYINAGLVLYDDYQGLVRFGSRVAIAHNVTIVASQGPNNSRIAAIPYVRDRLTVTSPVTVEDDAWLGTGSVILPGVTVGCGATIAAGAVVSHDVAPYTVVAGIPARLVRQLDAPSG